MTPRIGETVHYVPATQRFAGQCLAALVVNNINSPAITAIVWTPEGTTYAADADTDQQQPTGSFDEEWNFTPFDPERVTPGTWRHIH